MPLKLSVNDVAYILTDVNGNVLDWYISDELLELVSESLPNVTKEQIKDALLRNTDKADLIDDDGNVIRPAGSIIN